MGLDLSDCSIVIPVQIDSKERLEHIHFLYRYFNQYFIHHELIILEFGVKQQIHLPSNSSTQIEFIKSEEQFSPAIASNIAASMVNRPFFCKYDADALIHPKALFEAFDKLKKDSNPSFILPYNGISISVANPLRQNILQNRNFPTLPFFPKNVAIKSQEMYLKCQNSQGLIHHFQTDTFKKFGGYNENFIGWGYEDSEIVNRFMKLGAKKILLDHYNAFHLEHPRERGDEAQIFKNYCLKQTMNALSKEELLDCITSWTRFRE